jgi:hypothetical protein
MNWVFYFSDFVLCREQLKRKTIVPGLFVEDIVVDGFNSTLNNYLRSHTDFRNVTPLNALDKEDTKIVKIKIKKTFFISNAPCRV